MACQKVWIYIQKFGFLSSESLCSSELQLTESSKKEQQKNWIQEAQEDIFYFLIFIG